MKHIFPALCWAILIGGFFAACSKKPKPVDPVRGDLIFDQSEVKPMPDPNEKILEWDNDEAPPTGPIYFSYDAYTLADLETVAALALYLLHSHKIVALAGHASQEGTDDYNMQLGARRATAVRAYLDAAGIPENRITWISYGEERPVTEDPAQYHLNRRVEFRLEDPK